jgi:acyl dehydratase
MMNLGFEDFPVGREDRTSGLTVTDAHVVQWAGLTGDWYPVHLDETFAAQTEFGGRIAHGPFTFAATVGLLAQTGMYGDAVIAWLGATDLRAVAPVRIGDTVRGVSVVRDVRRSRTSPDRAVVTLGCTVLNQDGVTVMTFDLMQMMRSREPVPGAAATGLEA